MTLSLAELADPEHAVGIEELTSMFSFGVEFRPAPHRMRQALVVLSLAAAGYLLWRFTPVRKLLLRRLRLG